MTDQQTGGWTDGRLDRKMNGPFHIDWRINFSIFLMNDGPTDGWMDGRTDGWMDGQTDKQTDGQIVKITDGRKDRYTDPLFVSQGHVEMILCT